MLSGLVCVTNGAVWRGPRDQSSGGAVTKQWLWHAHNHSVPRPAVRPTGDRLSRPPHARRTKRLMPDAPPDLIGLRPFPPNRSPVMRPPRPTESGPAVQAG